MSGFYKTLRFTIGNVASLFFRTKNIGLENIPEKGGFILCCNHTHLLDVYFLVMAVKRHQIHFMAKNELFKNKLLAWFITKMGGFPVIRGSVQAEEGILTGENILKEGKVMGIFPEGTRSVDGRPKRAKSGVALIANETGAPVLPVSIYYEGKLNVFKKITVRFGELIDPSELKMQENNRAELKRVATLIMDKITELWEEGH